MAGLTAKTDLSYPRSALGTLLSERSAETDEPRTDLIATGLESKLQRLLQRSRIRRLLEPRTVTLELRDSGAAADGDQRRGDGIYSAMVTQAQRPGLYHFQLSVEAIAANGKRVMRARTLSTLVRARPDPEATEINARWLERLPNGPGTAIVTLIPFDRFGNFLGPGYADKIVATASDASFETSIEDALDGAYELRLRVPDRSADPRINISMDGVELYDGTFSELPRVSNRYGLSFHLGDALPHGTFNKSYNEGPSLGLDLEFFMTQRFSVQAMLGYHQFEGSVGSDTYLTHLSGTLRYYPTTRRVRVFVDAGVGAYQMRHDNSIFLGVNAGGGLSWQFRPKLHFETGYDYHTVFTDDQNSEFSVIRLGLRRRF